MAARRASGESIEEFDAPRPRRAPGPPGASRTTTTRAWPARFDEDGLGRRARPRGAADAAGAARDAFVFQGQELGLPDADVPPERVVDVDGRDPERAPIPWADEPSGGWSDPWLPLVVDAGRHSVQRQRSDPRSTLNLTRRLAALRRENPALQTGAQQLVDAAPDVLAWRRGSDLVAAVNFSAAEQPLAAAAGGCLLISTDADRLPGAATDRLQPAEAVLVRLPE